MVENGQDKARNAADCYKELEKEYAFVNFILGSVILKELVKIDIYNYFDVTSRNIGIRVRSIEGFTLNRVLQLEVPFKRRDLDIVIIEINEIVNEWAKNENANECLIKKITRWVSKLKCIKFLI